MSLSDQTSELKRELSDWISKRDSFDKSELIEKAAEIFRRHPATDSNVESVIAKHRERAATGLRKYGVTTERTDLSREQWLQHLQDELLDAAVYVQALLRQPTTAQPLGGVAAIFGEWPGDETDEQIEQALQKPDVQITWHSREEAAQWPEGIVVLMQTSDGYAIQDYWNPAACWSELAATKFARLDVLENKQ